MDWTWTNLQIVKAKISNIPIIFYSPNSRFQWKREEKSSWMQPTHEMIQFENFYTNSSTISTLLYPSSVILSVDVLSLTSFNFRKFWSFFFLWSPLTLTPWHCWHWWRWWAWHHRHKYNHWDMTNPSVPQLSLTLCFDTNKYPFKITLLYAVVLYNDNIIN